MGCMGYDNIKREMYNEVSRWTADRLGLLDLVPLISWNRRIQRKRIKHVPG